MNIKLLTEQHMEFLSLKGGCTELSESTLVKMSHCWKSQVAAHMLLQLTLCRLDFMPFADFIIKCLYFSNKIF